MCEALTLRRTARRVKSPGTARRSTFHHGNLPQALVTAAMAEIERVGIEGVSLRELAEKVGVARSAPYRHFSSKKELIEAAAAVVQNELLQAYASIPADLSPKSRLKTACEAYLNYIQEHPRLIQLLAAEKVIWPGQRIDQPPPKRSALALFRQMVGALMPDADGKAIDAATTACWSALHGLAMLRAAGIFQPFPADSIRQEDILNRILMMVAY